MKTAHLILLALCLAVLNVSDGAERPNIVVILADDMGFSDLGCYGGEIRTPNLDRLATNGLRFTQFYNTARCCPTRAALLTGLYSHQAGVGHMMEDRDMDGYRGDLNRRCVTIPEVLKPAGYRSYAVGKWHVTKHANPEGPKDNWPLQRGFDRYYGTIHGAGSYWDPSSLVRDNRMITPFNDPEYQPSGDYYYTDAISEHAVRFVNDHAREHAGQPFFLYVAFTAAHWPMQAKESDVARYRGKYDAGYEVIRQARFERTKKLGLVDPRWQLTPASGSWSAVADKPWEARCMEVYAAMVDCMDQGVGRLVGSLEKNGQLENTLIFFLQDNGGCAELIGRTGAAKARSEAPSLPAMSREDLQKGSTPKQTRDGYPVRQGRGVMPGPPDTFIAYGREWANVSNTPFREYKHWEHEGGISTPLIAHWPAGIPAARRNQLEKQPGHLIDLMATCVDVSGATYPVEFLGNKILPREGVSLRPALEGKSLDRPQPIFWEHEGNRAVREGRWKLVAKGPAGAWELYDMEADRTEMHNLAGAESARMKDMVAKWEAWAHRAGVIPWIWSPAYGSTGKAGAGAARFDLKQGDNLPKGRAPQIGGRAFTVSVEVTEFARDGVLVAQGGSAVGFSLYLKEGVPIFAVREDGGIHTVQGDKPLAAEGVTLTASLDRNGVLTLKAGEKALATGHAPGLISRLPQDGLQVGSDLNGAVGNYTAPFSFSGKLGRVWIEVE